MCLVEAHAVLLGGQASGRSWRSTYSCIIIIVVVVGSALVRKFDIINSGVVLEVRLPEPEKNTFQKQRNT